VVAVKHGNGVLVVPLELFEKHRPKLRLLPGLTWHYVMSLDRTNFEKRVAILAEKRQFLTVAVDVLEATT
jgi:hypothetical protein